MICFYWVCFVYFKFSIVLAKLERVWTEATNIKQKKLLKVMLSRIEPTTDPWGTIGIISLTVL